MTKQTQNTETQAQVQISASTMASLELHLKMAQRTSLSPSARMEHLKVVLSFFDENKLERPADLKVIEDRINENKKGPYVPQGNGNAVYNRVIALARVRSDEDPRIGKYDWDTVAKMIREEGLGRGETSHKTVAHHVKKCKQAFREAILPKLKAENPGANDLQLEAMVTTAFETDEVNGVPPRRISKAQAQHPAIAAESVLVFKPVESK